MRSTLAFLLLLFVSPPLALGTCPYVCNCCPLQGVRYLSFHCPLFNRPDMIPGKTRMATHQFDRRMWLLAHTFGLRRSLSKRGIVHLSWRGGGRGVEDFAKKVEVLGKMAAVVGKEDIGSCFIRRSSLSVGRSCLESKGRTATLSE